MKPVLFLILFITVAIFPSAFGQFFDRPGLTHHLSVEAGGYNFNVESTSNFDITDYEFSSDEKRLTIFISSNVQNNLGEFQIPKNLINGNFTFFLNDKELFPNVRGNERISFITVEFPGNGLHKLDIIGTTYLPEFSEIAQLILATSLISILFLKKFKKAIIR